MIDRWLGKLALAAVSGLTVLSLALKAEVGTDTYLVKGKEQLAQGKIKEAVRSLEAALKASPKNADALLNLGLAYKRLKNYEKAKTALRSALRAAPGTATANEANQQLLTLPRKVVAPRSRRIVAKIRGKRVAPAGLERVKLLAFYASWAQPCKQLQADLEKAKTEWADKIEFVAVDVDDPNNEALLEQYDVSPVPTVIFLGPAGNMVSYLIGYPGEETLRSQLKMVTEGKATAPTG